MKKSSDQCNKRLVNLKVKNYIAIQVQIEDGPLIFKFLISHIVE